MESPTLRSEDIKKQIEASEVFCAALSSRFQTAATSTEQTRIAHQYSQAINQLDSLRLLLVRVESRAKRSTWES